MDRQLGWEKQGCFTLRLAVARGSVATMRDRRAMLICGLLCLLAFCYMEWVALTQWMSGHWYLADVGNIHYCLANTLRGRFMWSPLMEGNHFAWHFTPLLLALSPVSLLSTYPVPLVTLYMAALAVCPIPIVMIYRRACDPGECPACIGLALGFLFLANHFVASLELANHFEVFFLLFFLCTMAAEGSPRAFGVFALLTLAVKEDAAVWLIPYLAWSALGGPRGERRRQFGAMAFCVMYLAVAAVVTWAVGRSQVGNISDYASRAREIRPGVDSLLTLAGLYASFALLPLLGGRAALLPLVPAPMLLVGFPFVRHLAYYYSYPFLPYLTLAAILGAVRLQRWLGARMAPQRAAVLVACLIAACAIAQLPIRTRTDGYRRVPFEISSRDQYRNQVAAELLPRDASVAIQHGLWGISPTVKDARMLSRKNIDPGTYVFLDLQSPIGMDRQEYLSLTRDLLGEADRKERTLLHDNGDIYLIGPRVAR